MSHKTDPVDTKFRLMDKLDKVLTEIIRHHSEFQDSDNLIHKTRAAWKAALNLKYTPSL